MENNKPKSEKEIFDDNKKRAIELLYKDKLSQNDIGFLNNFFNEFYIVKSRIIHENANGITKYKYAIYNEIYDEIEKRYDDFDPEKSPAFKIMQDKEEEHYKDIGKPLTKIREKETSARNGFATIVLVVGSTIIAGIALGALLWFIR